MSQLDFNKLMSAIMNTSEVNNSQLHNMIIDFQPDNPDQMTEIIEQIRNIRPNYFCN